MDDDEIKALLKEVSGEVLSSEEEGTDDILWAISDDEDNNYEPFSSSDSDSDETPRRPIEDVEQEILNHIISCVTQAGWNSWYLERWQLYLEDNRYQTNRKNAKAKCNSLHSRPCWWRWQMLNRKPSCECWWWALQKKNNHMSVNVLFDATKSGESCHVMFKIKVSPKFLYDLMKKKRERKS